MAVLSPVEKIKLIDGTIVDLANVNQIAIPDNADYNVTWNILDFTGSVSAISGTDDDYLLTINETRITES